MTFAILHTKEAAALDNSPAKKNSTSRECRIKAKSYSEKFVKCS